MVAGIKDLQVTKYDIIVDRFVYFIFILNLKVPSRNANNS